MFYSRHCLLCPVLLDCDKLKFACRHWGQVAHGPGKDVCWKAFNKLLGTSDRTTTRQRKGALDMRREVGGISAPRDAPKSQCCHEFF